MSAVRPSPLNYSRLRDKVQSPSVRPVFAQQTISPGWSCPAPPGGEPAPRRFVSDTCLSVQPVRAPLYRHPLNAPPAGRPVGISPQQAARRQQQQSASQHGVRRRLFTLGSDTGQAGQELELAATKMSTAEIANNVWRPENAAEKEIDKFFHKSHSTTTCGVENVRACSNKGIDYFCRVQNLEQKSLRDGNPDLKLEARSKVLGSPISQRSQDSGFSDSGESNCESQGEDRKGEKKVNFARRAVARTISKIADAGEPSSQTEGKNDGNVTAQKNNTLLMGNDSTLRVRASRVRAGHTPKASRLSRTRLQVVEEGQRLVSSSSACLNASVVSRGGPMTSSPVSAGHVLQCSAIERELDSILERVERDEFRLVTVRQKSPLNETSIDFSPKEPRDLAARPAAGGSVTLRTGERARRLQRRWSQLEPPGHGSGQPRRPGSVWNLEAAVERFQTRQFCSLPRGFQPHQSDARLRIADVSSPSVRRWLREQTWEVEVECMNTLQSKSVISDLSHLLALSARNARTNIRDIQVRAKTVSREFTALFKRMEYLDVAEVPHLARTVTASIDSFIKEYEQSHPDEDKKTTSHMENLDKLRSLMAKMLEYVKSCGQINRTFKVDDLVQVLTSLAQAFNHLVDLILGEEVKVLLSSLSPDRDILCLKLGLRSVTSVGLDGGRLCRILANQGAVSRLTELIGCSRLRQVRPQALRSLATVCCVQQGVKAFEKVDGVKLVTSVLTDPRSTEDERSECAGVIAQVTSPGVDSIHHVRGINEHVEDIVRELTGLAATTDSAETLLLASAAMANLTFLNIGAVRLLLHSGAAKVLVQAVQNDQQCSLFMKDQVATVLANMASLAECHDVVLRSGGLDALLAFLAERLPAGDTPPPDPADPAVQAVERVQQKSAIALSRLCVRRTVALEVADRGGLSRLIQLCRDGTQRNHSDGVLVACLATLRKMAAACGMETFKANNGLDLVEPRLLESFLLCSSRQESYV